jgi:hypothetical protein
MDKEQQSKRTIIAKGHALARTYALWTWCLFTPVQMAWLLKNEVRL